jgi:hypothetical protein
VTPRLPIYDAVNSHYGHPKVVCQLILILFATCINLANRSHSLVVQASEAMGLSTAHSPLLFSVSHIVSSSSQKEMCGINASRIVTFVTSVKPFGDRTVHQCPSNTMCQTPTVVNLERTVSIVIDLPGPQPATVGLFNPVPETNVNSKLTLSGAAIGRWSLSNIPRFSAELFSACLTSQYHKTTTLHSALNPVNA